MSWAPALLTAALAAVFPGTQPQLAGDGSRVFLAFGHDDAVKVAASTDEGQSFGQPVTIAVPGRMSLGSHRGPRIAVTRRAVLVAVVAGATGGGRDGDVLLFRSTDAGATWRQPVVINDVPGAAREGLHALAATPEGLVVVAWLDLRQTGTRIFAAVSRDHGVTWSSDHLAYASPSGSVCECCHPSIALDDGAAGGEMAIMFRNSLDGHRDMYVVRSRDGASFTAARKSGTGSWRLDACPMDGGALVLEGGQAVSVWRRDTGVYLATLGRDEQRIGTGRDPAMSRAGPHRDVAWSSPDGVTLLRGAGPAAVLGPGRFPAVLALERRTIVAWEQRGEIRVMTVAR